MVREVDFEIPNFLKIKETTSSENIFDQNCAKNEIIVMISDHHGGLYLIT